jgi:hypothetical protein
MNARQYLPGASDDNIEGTMAHTLSKGRLFGARSQKVATPAGSQGAAKISIFFFFGKPLYTDHVSAETRTLLSRTPVGLVFRLAINTDNLNAVIKYVPKPNP